MAGHSHWKQVQHKKGAIDQKRSRLFSKLLNAISVAARQEPNPQFNPRLRAAIDKARQNNVPQENIEKAVKRVGLGQERLEEFVLEAYGPGGAALIIEVIADNKNRAIAEIKSILKNHQSRLAEPGSVRWVFDRSGDDGWRPKFKQTISAEDKIKLENLISQLENSEDIQGIYINI